MMRCAVVESVAVFADSSATSTIAIDVLSLLPPGTACTATHFVLLDDAELSHYLSSPFKLSPEDAGLVVMAVAGCWAIGWIFRVLIGMLRERTDVSVEE